MAIFDIIVQEYNAITIIVDINNAQTADYLLCLSDVLDTSIVSTVEGGGDEQNTSLRNH